MHAADILAGVHDVHGIPGDSGCGHDGGPGGSTAVSRFDEQQPAEGLHHDLSTSSRS
jgi:hypothetical protein